MEQALPLEPLQGLRVPGGTPVSDILVSSVIASLVVVEAPPSPRNMLPENFQLTIRTILVNLHDQQRILARMQQQHTAVAAAQQESARQLATLHAP